MMGYYRTMERKAAGGRTVQPYMERFSAGQQGTGGRGEGAETCCGRLFGRTRKRHMS